MSLGSLRLYGLILEHRLADVTVKIEAIGNRYASLEEYHASLLSPSRIYNYAKMQLNMVTASEIETIKLDGSGGRDIADASGVSAPGRLESLFIGTANARD
jgi:hypothetical protein